MSIEISVARRDVYTTDGSPDTTLYEIQANAGDFIQDMQFETAADLVTLRDALSHYINKNNLYPTQSDTIQP